MSITITQCGVEKCEGSGQVQRNGNRVFPRGYCINHYRKLRKYGDPLKGRSRKKDATILSHYLAHTYYGMVSRCNHTKNLAYEFYGKRGISVCDRWLEPDKGFWNFVEDMGDRPNGYTLDRIDNDRGYSPENCRWASWSEQSKNKRNNNKTVGVYWHVDNQKWVARMSVKGTMHNLGSFRTEEEAIRARKEFEQSILT